MTGIDGSGNPTTTWSLSSSGINFPDGTTQTTAAIGNGGTAVQTTGSYADPSWITSLSGSKITGSLNIASIFSRTTSNNDVIVGVNDGYGTGVHGFSTGGYGVYGHTNSNVSAGVYGANPVGDAGRFDGNVIVSGTFGIGVTSPGATLEVKVGGTTLADAWTTRSSARFKTNIQPITAALDKVLQLRGVTFNWKDTRQPSIGFIAEEVAHVLPEAVEYEKNGKDTKGLDYSKVTPMLVEAIKAQQQKIEDLQRENARLQIRNGEQEARLTTLEGLVNAMIQKKPAKAQH